MSCREIGHLSSSGGNGMLADRPLICLKLKEPDLGRSFSRAGTFPRRSIELDIELKEHEGLEHWELMDSIVSLLK